MSLLAEAQNRIETDAKELQQLRAENKKLRAEAVFAVSREKELLMLRAENERLRKDLCSVATTTGNIACDICRKGPKDGVPLFRQSPKGQLPAVFRCKEHVTAQVDKGIENLVNIISGKADSRLGLASVGMDWKERQLDPRGGLLGYQQKEPQ